MKRNILFIIALSIIICACKNYRLAMDISKNYSREYTGIDTLIQINGYYYQSIEESNSPFILTTYGGYYKYFARFACLNQFNNYIKINPPKNRSTRGNYKIFNDTIRAKWISKYDWASYDIFEEHFVILNDTTLKRVFFAVKRLDRKESQIDPESAENIFIFYPYEFPSDSISY